MADIWNGIAIGGAGGAIAGLTVWLVRYLHTKSVECIHKQRVYKWLMENTTSDSGEAYRSTRAIASWTNQSFQDDSMAGPWRHSKKEVFPGELP